MDNAQEQRNRGGQRNRSDERERSRRKTRPQNGAQAKGRARRSAESPANRDGRDRGRRSRPTGARADSRPPRQASTSAERGSRPPQEQKRRARRTSKEQAARMRKLIKFRRAGVISAAFVLAFGAIVGLLFFARPTTSEVEKRTLTAKPAFTWSTFWSGEYFSDLALWYSDTYPLREQLVAADQKLSSLHGIKTDTQMIGGTKQADELPPADAQKKDSEADGESGDESEKKPTSGASSRAKRERGEVEVPAQEVMAEAIQNQVLDGLYVKGDAAYNIYYFSQEAVEEYADAINKVAEELEGEATVYSLVAPNASGILLSDQEVKDLGGTNQVDAIEYFYSLYDDGVHPIDSVPKLQEHDDEYIFFRTDHHWTALGAYYAYVAFCEEKGIEPENLDDMKHVNFGDFLGSLYSQLNSAEMAANPDYVEAWIPNGTNKMRLWDQDGTVSDDYNVITDTSDWDITGKTMAFIMGDQPLQKIENPDIDDGSTCLLIKDSFGDFFAPWLVDSYQTVYVGDFRYFESNIDDFVRENDVDDVIFCNNVTLAGGGVVGPAILGRL